MKVDFYHDTRIKHKMQITSNGNISTLHAANILKCIRGMKLLDSFKSKEDKERLPHLHTYIFFPFSHKSTIPCAV